MSKGELRCEKWCFPNLTGDTETDARLKGSWLRTHIKWLRIDDVVRVIKDDKLAGEIKYVVMSKPFWSLVHKCWDIKLGIEKKNDI